MCGTCKIWHSSAVYGWVPCHPVQVSKARTIISNDHNRQAAGMSWERMSDKHTVHAAA